MVGFGAGLTWASAVVQFGLSEKHAATGWLAAPTRTVKAAQNKIGVAARTASMRASLMLTPLYTRVSRKQRPEENSNGKRAVEVEQSRRAEMKVSALFTSCQAPKIRY